MICEHLVIRNSNAVNSETQSRGKFSEAFPNIYENAKFILELAGKSLLEITEKQTNTKLFPLAFAASTVLKMCKPQLHALNERMAASNHYNFEDRSKIESTRDRLMNVIKKLDENDEIKKINKITDSGTNIPEKEFSFKDGWPVAISDVELDEIERSLWKFEPLT